MLCNPLQRTANWLLNDGRCGEGDLQEHFYSHTQEKNTRGKKGKKCNESKNII